MATEVDASGKRTEMPPSDAAAMLNLATFLEQTQPAGLGGPDGQTVPLPVEVYDVLVQAAGAMAAGRAIAIAPLEQRLTQQAADLLGIGRPSLVKLLESHEIPFGQPGRHRRARLADVPDHSDRRRRDRRERLAAMTRQAVEDGLFQTTARTTRAPFGRARTWPAARSGHMARTLIPRARGRSESAGSRTATRLSTGRGTVRR